MKAKIMYKDGWVLVFPVEGVAPMLFLEWLEGFAPALCPIHKITKDFESETFKVRLNEHKRVYESAVQFINNNI